MSELIRKKTDCPYCGAKESMFPIVFFNKESNCEVDLSVTIIDVALKEDIDSKSWEPKFKAGFYSKFCKECGYVAYFVKDIIDNKGEL